MKNQSGVTVSISDTFDGGNIKFIEMRPTTNDSSSVDVIVEIKPDIYTELEKIAHMQYFSFRATISGLTDEMKEQKVNYIIANADKVSFPEAWPGTTVFYSKYLEDADSWMRKRDTYYMNGKLGWQHAHNANGSVYFSYFPPFSYARHLTLISNCAVNLEANQNIVGTVGTLGKTLEGRELDYITLGDGKLVCWIIHRQHPGESMAEFYAEGLLTRLLGLEKDGEVDDLVIKLLKNFTFYIVPCMCPDGVVKGHLRTNACGANLNREWTSVEKYEAPTLERSPEVYYILAKMDETGVDCFLDIHGDEELPFNFLSGASNIPNWNQRLESLHGAFTAAYTRCSQGDMQKKYGYPVEPPEVVIKYMNVATNQIGHRFDCFAVTLEMPFKDCFSNPDPERGWSPARSRLLGANVLEALDYMQPYLRTKEPDFWNNLSAEDTFIPTTDDYQDEFPTKQDGFKILNKRLFSDVHETNKTRGT